MPPKKRTPIGKCPHICCVNPVTTTVFVKMVMDGRKSLLYKRATKTSLDFPKVNYKFELMCRIVRSTDSQEPVAIGKCDSLVNPV